MQYMMRCNFHAYTSRDTDRVVEKVSYSTQQENKG
jgi:hypothetical protein